MSDKQPARADPSEVHDYTAGWRDAMRMAARIARGHGVPDSVVKLLTPDEGEKS